MLQEDMVEETNYYIASNFKQTKKDIIIAFLQYLVDFPYSESVPSSECNQLNFFQNKEDVFKFFCVGSHDGINGEFEHLISQNLNCPMSFEHFKNTWKIHFPNLLTESDRPQ